MNNDIRILEVNQMQKMSIDDIVNMYRQGYRLEEFYPNMDKTLPYSRNGYQYQFASPAICPTAVTKGSTKNIRVDVASPGTPPYTFKVQRDGTEILTYTGGATEVSKTWPYVFNETLGTYTYKGFVIDSCPGAPKTSAIDSCTITVQEAPVTPPSGVNPIFIAAALGLVVLAVATSK